MELDDMTADPQWADLHVGLVSRVADCCTLHDYVSCRAVCRAWRAAILPLTSRPLAPVCGDGTEAGGQPLSLGVCSDHAQRWTQLLGVPQPSRFRSVASCRCVGARDGWVALAAATANGRRAGRSIVSLFNPLTGTEIPLHASLYDPKCERAAKVVFSPDPTPRDFAAVSMCRPNRLAVHRSTDGHSSRLTLDTDALMDGADLVDVAYSEDGKVYCLTTNGDVHVLHLNRRRHRGRLRPVEVEPLVTGTDVFSTPYDTISRFTDAKNLVLCNGALYQVWRRPSGAGSALAAVGIWDQQLLYISESDVFVLRYDSWLRPCWTETRDLGGHTVFLGTNDATAVHGDGATELMRGNCLYYWASRLEGGYEAVLHNLATGSSTRWLPATGGACVTSPLWYFLPSGGGDVEAPVENDAASEEVVSIAATVYWEDDADS
ncbi:hypothetical protein ABZP36_008065 [Zizania latifolia]